MMTVLTHTRLITSTSEGRWITTSGKLTFFSTQRLWCTMYRFNDLTQKIQNSNLCMPFSAEVVLFTVCNSGGMPRRYNILSLK